MRKVINNKTKVIKELSSEELVSMYIATNEWSIYKEEKQEPTTKINIKKFSKEENK